MRIFAGDKVRSMMEWLGMEKGVAIESKTVSKQIERAQKAVEARNFETRKHVLKYDDVMNKQRETIYGLRRQLMFEPEHREYLLGETGVAHDLLHDLTASFLNLEAAPDTWDVDTYAAEIESIYAVDPARDADVDFKTMNPDTDRGSDLEKGDRRATRRKKNSPVRNRLRAYERYIMLNIIDSQWKDHLLSIDQRETGHRPRRLRAERSARRIQKAVVRYVPGHARPHRHEHDEGAVPSRDRSATKQEERERLERLEHQRARRQAAGMAFTGAMATATSAGAEAAATRRSSAISQRSNPTNRATAARARNSRNATGREWFDRRSRSMPVCGKMYSNEKRQPTRLPLFASLSLRTKNH